MPNPTPHPAIVARQVTKRIDTATHTVEILKGIDFVVERGQFVAIMGASGSIRWTSERIAGTMWSGADRVRTISPTYDHVGDCARAV